MKHPTIFAQIASLFLLLILCMAAPPARAQNQTPANNPPSVGWIDPATWLTWTKEDTGWGMDWNQANAYCTNLRLGGYTDWRLPTIDELQGIYDASAGEKHVKGGIKLSTTYQWSGSQGSDSGTTWTFWFRFGSRATGSKEGKQCIPGPAPGFVCTYDYLYSALCVRR